MAKDSIVRHLYSEILDTYPFLSHEERSYFITKADKLLNDKRKDVLTDVDRLLVLLNNPHADTWPVVEEKNKKPPKRLELKIEEGILFIKVPGWTKRVDNLAEDLISFCKENKDKYKAIIIDVRGNTGGSSFIAHKFAGIFFNKDVTFGRFIKRIKGEGLKENDAVMSPTSEFYTDKPLAILINNECFSSNELFLAPFKVTGRAVLIGDKTSGGSGNPVEVEFSIEGKKYYARIPTWRFVLKGEDKPIEETKILPDIPYSGDDILDFATKTLKAD